ncbi:MAG: hypothetical protein AABX82_08200, partial [Nanoarchaeota archaeon]
MDTKIADLIVKKLRNISPESVEEQIQLIPSELNAEERNYVKSKLRTNAYYQQLKRKQLREREALFYDLFTIENPYKSQDRKIANAKERELFRAVLYKHMNKARILQLLQHYVIPCSWLSDKELKLFTDPLFISIIDSRLRSYVRVRTTKLGSNQFAWYLMKENWKRESVAHLIWKFELKRLFGFVLEHEIQEQFRVDLFKKRNEVTLIGEIVCTRQAIDAAFKRKIALLLEEK